MEGAIIQSAPECDWQGLRYWGLDTTWMASTLRTNDTIVVNRRGPDGIKAPFTFGNQPSSMALLELPALVQERLGIAAVEIYRALTEAPRSSESVPLPS